MPLSEREYMRGEPPDDAPFVWDDVQHRYIRRAEYLALYSQRQPPAPPASPPVPPLPRNDGMITPVYAATPEPVVSNVYQPPVSVPVQAAGRPSYRVGWVGLWLMLAAMAIGAGLLLLHLLAV